MDKKPIKRQSFEIQGKVPPQAIELEEAVLGAIMLQSDAYEQVNDILKPECFYKDSHVKVYAAIQSLVKQNQPIDILTVTKELKKLGTLQDAGGIFAVTQLTERVVGAANILHHARVVVEMYLKRELIRINSEFINQAYDDTSDVFELLEDNFKEVDNIRNYQSEGLDIPFRVMVTERVSEKEELVKSGVKFTGITTGNPKLDKILGGFVNSNLIIVAARPAMGKSVKALNYAKIAAQYTKNMVVVFSLEMSASELVDRFIVEEAKVELHRYRANDLSQYDLQKIQHARDELNKLPIQIYDEGGITPTFVRKKCKKVAKFHGPIGIIVIDYLQLMTTEEKVGSREQEVSKISRTLKGIAKELNIPVIALSQVGRTVEQSSDKRPDLSHLRECLSVNTSYIYGKNNIQRNCSSPINLVSLNKNKIQMNKSINIPKESNKVYRVKTSSGRFVDATLDHPILTSSGFKKLKDLSNKDSLAVAINFCQDGEYIEESRFIGWMLGNGSFIGYSSPSFIISDETVANDFVEFINKRFLINPRYKKHWSKKVFQYEITNPNGHNTAREWLKEHDLHNKRAWEKYIPDWFMEKADKKSICELMQGLFETDGSIYTTNKKNCVTYSSTSELLINQINYLLAKIGIIAFVDNGFFSKKAKHISYKLTINNAENIKLFMSLIQLRGRKGKAFEKFDLNKKTSNLSNRISYDSCEQIKRWLIDNNYDGNLIQTHGGRRATKTKVKEISKVLNDKLFDKEFGLVMSDNIYWDSISSITELEEVPVFDRSVENAHNFVVNGIIVHNSGAIEQDADVVMFIYRPSYYFDYGKHPDQDYSMDMITEADYNDVAEIRIAKNRNGVPATTIKERFYGKFSTFEEYDKKNEYQEPFETDNINWENPF